MIPGRSARPRRSSGSARPPACLTPSQQSSRSADRASRTVRLSSRNVILLGGVRDTGCPCPAVESPPVGTSESRATASPDDLAVTAERCAAQLLGGDPAGSAEEVAGRLLAIQAQDLPGRAACGPGAFSGTVGLGCRLRAGAALAGRHLSEPRDLVLGPFRGLLVAASADHPAATRWAYTNSVRSTLSLPTAVPMDHASRTDPPVRRLRPGRPTGVTKLSCIGS